MAAYLLYGTCTLAEGTPPPCSKEAGAPVAEIGQLLIAFVGLGSAAVALRAALKRIEEHAWKWMIATVFAYILWGMALYSATS